MYKIGLSTNGKTVNENLFIQYKKSGITVMEIAMTKEEFDEIDFSLLKKWSDSHGVELWSLHLPFRPEHEVNIASLEEETRKNAISYYSELIKKGTQIGIKIFVVHPNCNEPLEEGKIREQRLSYAKECLDVLAEFAANHGAVIAVENLPRTCLARNSDEILMLLDANDKLRVCYDTNHLMGQEATEFIGAVGNKIITLHVSDYDFVNERHWLPGEGKNDWRSIINALEEAGYNGVWMYEIRFTCPSTIIRERDLTCDDFVKNAQELFENKSLTTISKHKESLGMWG